MAQVHEAWKQIDQLSIELDLVPRIFRVIPESEEPTSVLVVDQTNIHSSYPALHREVVFIPGDGRPPYPAFGLDAVIRPNGKVLVGLELTHNLGPLGIEAVEIPADAQETAEEAVEPYNPVTPSWWQDSYPSRVSDMSPPDRDVIYGGEIFKLLYDAPISSRSMIESGSSSPEQTITQYLATLAAYLAK